jgi:hypothetical protein
MDNPMKDHKWPVPDFKIWGTLEAGVGENEKLLVEVRGSHPSPETSEGWPTNIYGLGKGAPPRHLVKKLPVNYS